MHRETYSICEGYALSYTYLRDTPQRLYINEVPDDVYIPPVIEIEPYIDDIRYLTHYLKNCGVRRTTLHGIILV